MGEKKCDKLLLTVADRKTHLIYWYRCGHYKMCIFIVSLLQTTISNVIIKITYSAKYYSFYDVIKST